MILPRRHALILIGSAVANPVLACGADDVLPDNIYTAEIYGAFRNVMDLMDDGESAESIVERFNFSVGDTERIKDVFTLFNNMDYSLVAPAPGATLDDRNIAAYADSVLDGSDLSTRIILDSSITLNPSLTPTIDPYITSRDMFRNNWQGGGIRTSGYHFEHLYAGQVRPQNKWNNEYASGNYTRQTMTSLPPIDDPYVNGRTPDHINYRDTGSYSRVVEEAAQTNMHIVEFVDQTTSIHAQQVHYIEDFTEALSDCGFGLEPT